MTTQFEILPDEPIMVVTVVDFDPEIDGIHALDQQMKTLNEQPEPVFFVLNLLEAHLNFEDFVKVTNETTREVPIFRHPKIRENLLVTQDPMLIMGAKGLDSSVFGHIKMKMFKTVDEALDYARNAVQP